MDDGVLSLQLIPARSRAAARAELRGLVHEALRIRSAVAFWSSEPSLVSSTLTSKLSNGGFLCVDVHLPTNLDILADMVRAGASVDLHLWEAAPLPGESKLKMPPHLLHPKMFLADCADGEALLWVGSHNFSRRALGGLNIEASLLARIRQNGALYNDSVAHLEWMRSRCTPFDLSALDYYKWLQGASAGDEEWTVELESEPRSLIVGERITLFDADETSHRRLRSVGTSVVLSVAQRRGFGEQLYRASVRDTGMLDRAGLEFEARLHAWHDADRVPRLEGPAAPDFDRHPRAQYWATLEVLELIAADFATFEPPPAKRFEPAPKDELAQAALTENILGNVRRTNALVLRAVDLDRYVSRRDEGDLAELETSDHAARSRSESRSIVRKKIVRRR